MAYAIKVTWYDEMEKAHQAFLRKYDRSATGRIIPYYTTVACRAMIFPKEEAARTFIDSEGLCRWSHRIVRMRKIRTRYAEVENESVSE